MQMGMIVGMLMGLVNVVHCWNHSQSGVLMDPDLDFSKWPPNEEQRLLRFILRTYDKSVRPVWNASHTVTVHVGLTLTQIFNVNEKKQILSMNVWLEQAWMDERLRWDPEEYSGVALLTVPTRFLWTPDIVLLNNAEDFSHGIVQTNVNVYPDGSVLWAPPVQSHSVCKLNVALFPFDQQLCSLRYASWIYDASQVDVTNRSHKINMDNGNYIENGEWQVVDTLARRNIRQHTYYPVQYADVTFTLYLRRRVLYYMYNIILPCSMLSALTLLQFWLPCESGEKVTLGLTVLLAYSVFSFNIGEKLPETSDVVPLIAIYISCITGISAISVGFSVIVLNIRHGGEDNSGSPGWLRFLAFKMIARLVCWRKKSGNRMLHRWMAMEKNLTQTIRLLSIQISSVCPPMQSDEWQSMQTADNADQPETSTDQNQNKPVSLGNKRKSTVEVATAVFDRFGRVLAKLERDLKHEQLVHEWRQIAEIFDRLFFWLIASVTIAWAVVMFGIAPVFNLTHNHH